ncbi:MAG: dihydropteroate synthase [Acidobacteria bacterium]|nr:dihydropteroate synthase [Acidobacteriota bacterium]
MPIWKTSRRELDLSRPLVMGILNATPDSFSDGGQAFSPGDALLRAEQIANEGGDIIDIGGESTRPGSKQVSVEEEIRRVVPAIEAISKRFDFGKTFEQNLQLIGGLNRIVENFPEYPMMIGSSRKSFIGKILGGAGTDERLLGSLAAAAIAVWNGAAILRVHDVLETVELARVVNAVEEVSTKRSAVSPI